MVALTGKPDIVIEFLALRNRHARAGGFVPMLRINGQLTGDDWHHRGFSFSEALAAAAEVAAQEAARYCGDWILEIHAAPEMRDADTRWEHPDYTRSEVER